MANEIILTVDGAIGTIKLNRPKQLNSLSPPLIHQLIAALHELAEHPETTLTVITGEGRFFSAGVDVTNGGGQASKRDRSTEGTDALKLLGETEGFGWVDLIGKLLIRHPKPVVFALNGPVVGISAAWTALADIVVVADNATLHVPFSSLGLIPEGGSAVSYTLRMGVGMASEVLMFGRKLTAQEMVACGFANRILPAATFQQALGDYLATLLQGNNRVAVLKAKRMIRELTMPTLLQGNARSVEEMASHAITGIPAKEIAKKAAELKAKSKSKI
ncbi:peroxisomal d3,d2-enoyl-CoA isomerase-like protein [Hyaloraphidium curvatum]|nr:peroxisomal d3,d2-enoyl-CoA isomerase-like protein [Hyaloraphidium curvatum]